MQANSEKVYLENLDFAKMVLMFLVVLGHSIAVPNNDWLSLGIESNSFLRVLNKWIGSYHIYTFVLISGYIFAYIKNERNGYTQIRSFFKTKAKRLLIPYVFIAVVWSIPFNTFFYNFSFVDIIHYYLFCEQPSVLWFLIMLFGCFSIAFLLFDIIKKRSNSILFLSLLFYFIGVFAATKIPNYFQLWSILKFFFFFCLGMVIRLTDMEKLLHGGGYCF